MNCFTTIAAVATLAAAVDTPPKKIFGGGSAPVRPAH